MQVHHHSIVAVNSLPFFSVLSFLLCCAVCVIPFKIVQHFYPLTTTHLRPFLRSHLAVGYRVSVCARPFTLSPDMVCSKLLSPPTIAKTSPLVISSVHLIFSILLHIHISNAFTFFNFILFQGAYVSCINWLNINNWLLIKIILISTNRKQSRNITI